MAVDEFGREIPAERNGRRGEGERSPSPNYVSPTRSGVLGAGGGSSEGAPSNLYEALPTSRYGRSSDDRSRDGGFGGGSSRKRRHRSESPPHSRKDRDSGRDRDGGRKPSKQQPHPSSLYVEEPMLCQYLWKEANPDKVSSSNNDTTTEGENNDNEEHPEYAEYRQGYCLNYVRTFFNDHMDDSWFR